MKLSGMFGLRPNARYISASVAALGALAITAQANAADIYAPGPGGFKDIPVVAVPPPLWTGFYAGINVGAAWTHLNVNRFIEPGATSCVAPGNLWPSNDWKNIPGFCFPGRDLNSTNAFGGGQFGYNWQGWGNFVFGLEVDLEGVGGGNERSFFGRTRLDHGEKFPRGTPIAATFKEDGGFAGDVTGRLGYTWGNWMLYAKGGFAWFDPHLSASAVAFDKNGLPFGSISGFDNNNTLTGWTVGGGVEWLLNPNWSVKLEYLHYDFGLNDNNWNATFCKDGVCSTFGNFRIFDRDLTVDTVKLGVNYHLTSGYVPLK
jgi:outer membrane immunogenic protein